MYVDCLFLKENARGNGTGKQIMELIRAFSKEEDCSIIQWQTPNFNTGAIKFTRLGAERKTKKDFSGRYRKQFIFNINRDFLKPGCLYFNVNK
jgi:GNAT superfamily N-acetyltransferase